MNTSTNRCDTVHIDEQSCKAKAGVQWLLENEHRAGTHPITTNNIEMLICGQDGFARIAGDLEAAQGTVDLICWGFDPGMELVRNKPGHWPRGETYGGLLQRLATRAVKPVKVRLLIWYDFLAGVKQKHMPGYTDSLLPARTSDEWLASSTALAGGMYRPQPTSAKPVAWQRSDHCVAWWRWAMDKKNADRIEVRMRDGDKAAIQRSLGREPNPPQNTAGSIFASEESLLVGFGTHHQKTVLIDYRHDEGAKAVGYVMGLNSITSYWDTREHLFNDPRRELERDKPPGDKTEAWERAKRAGGKLDAISIDPYQDYACRIQGEALKSIDDNFRKAWQRAGHPTAGHRGHGDGPETAPATPAKLASSGLQGSRSRVQIVRTQPEENDWTIKNTYWHATQYARKYIYMENQYFQYRDWAEHLKAERKDYRTWYQKCSGQGPEAQGILHAFIVVPRPEIAEMAPRTFDMVKTLGRSDQMQDLDIDNKNSGQYAAMQKEDQDMKNWLEQQKTAFAQPRSSAHPRPTLPMPTRSQVGKDAAEIKEPSARDLEAMGLKVLIGMLVSYDKDASVKHRPDNPGDKYRQIYIHSKLLLIDDAFFTVGSANLNQRSMAVDSEINLATDDSAKAMALRKEIWRMHTGGLDGGDGSPNQIADTFGKWERHVKANDSAKKKGQPLTGFLTLLRDSKFSFIRYA